MAVDKTIWFLITYDRKKLRMADMERLHNGENAVDMYEEREHQYADQPHMEVVLLGADSEEAIPGGAGATAAVRRERAHSSGKAMTQELRRESSVRCAALLPTSWFGTATARELPDPEAEPDTGA